MVAIKRMLAALLAALSIFSCTELAYAQSDPVEFDTPRVQAEPLNATDSTRIGDLKSQLEALYRRVGEELNIDYLYVKILHLIAGGKATYADALPDIYTDLTLSALPGAFDIDGAEQDYDRTAPWAVCGDKSVTRPNGYYLPDAAYNVAADVVAIMNNRFAGDRGSMQGYFDVLTTDAKRSILFCEAVLEYAGSRDAADAFFLAYLEMLEAKEAGENVLTKSASGVVFKETYRNILVECGISAANDLNILSTILSFDGVLAAGSGTDSVCTETVIPFVPGYSSRDNMMLAAMSIVGKCRYVWGGGHMTTGNIVGINPMWNVFHDAYLNSDVEVSSKYSKCVIPDGSWCPMHGKQNDWDGCLFRSKTAYSAADYIAERQDVLDLSGVDLDKLTAQLEADVDFSAGVTSHRLDGLDCSGYTSWLYNQVTGDNYVFDSGAYYFIGQRGIKRMKSGTTLVAGDVFSWGDHIVVIVGPVKEGSKAYVMLEAGRTNVKFGVAYYRNAKNADIAEALEVAKEANLLVGNMDETEATRKFSMTIGFGGNYPGDPKTGYRAWGRLRVSFADEDTIVPEYGKTITEMTAQEIIQYTMEHTPYQYISGLETYSGEHFDLEGIRSSMTTVKTDLVDFSKIQLTFKLD